MAKGLEAGKSFLAGVIAKLPEADRARAQELLQSFESLGGGALVTAVGDGTLAQADFSRQANELKTRQDELEAQRQELDARDQALETWRGDLASWYEREKARLAAGGGGANASGQPNPTGHGTTNPEAPTGMITEEQWNERMGGERAAFLGFQRDQNLITREHYAKFHEIVDLEPLLQHPQIAQVGLRGVYELVHRERLDKHRTDAQAAHDKQIADAAVAKFREEQGANMPYVPPTGAGSGSPLDALEQKGSGPLVDQAVQHYNRLQAERAGSGTL